MMTTYETAQQAIERSRSHTEIAWCDDTPDNREYLASECDGDGEANGVAEYWADDPDSPNGMAWRVHVQVGA